MNRHVGASFTLSVLVVVFFAVVLYQPEHARRSRRPGPPERSSTRPSPESPDLAPPPTPGIPLTEATEAAVPGATGPILPRGAVASTARDRRFPVPDESEGSRRTPPTSRATVGGSPGAIPSDPPARIQVVSRRRALPSPRRSAFTHVGEGESLTDVAIRVYGTSDAAGTLWLANRDIIDRRDRPLRQGMLLRTP